MEVSPIFLQLQDSNLALIQEMSVQQFQLICLPPSLTAMYLPNLSFLFFIIPVGILIEVKEYMQVYLMYLSAALHSFDVRRWVYSNSSKFKFNWSEGVYASVSYVFVSSIA